MGSKQDLARGETNQFVSEFVARSWGRYIYEISILVHSFVDERNSVKRRLDAYVEQVDFGSTLSPFEYDPHRGNHEISCACMRC
jgi:hypothetical protein